MATCHRLGLPWIEPQWRHEVLFSPQLSVLALRPTKPPLQWILWLFSRGQVTEARHWPHTSHLGVRLRMSRFVPLLCLCAFCGSLQCDPLPFGCVKMSHLCFVIWQYFRQMSTAVTFASVPLIFWLFV